MGHQDSFIDAMAPRLIATVTIVVAIVAAGTPSSSTATTTKPPTPAPAPRPETIEEAERRLDAIMNNTRSRENYIRCFMDRGICNREANAIKKILGDALATNCSKCGERERAAAARFVKYVQAEQPDTWAKLQAKYGRGGGGGRAAAEEGGKAAEEGGKAAKEGGKAAEGKVADASHSDTDDDDDDDEDDDDEKEKKAKGEQKKKDGAKGKQKTDANATIGHASVSMIF